jgi:hypothetical protein
VKYIYTDLTLAEGIRLEGIKPALRYYSCNNTLRRPASGYELIIDMKHGTNSNPEPLKWEF